MSLPKAMREPAAVTLPMTVASATEVSRTWLGSGSGLGSRVGVVVGVRVRVVVGVRVRARVRVAVGVGVRVGVGVWVRDNGEPHPVEQLGVVRTVREEVTHLLVVSS